MMLKQLIGQCCVYELLDQSLTIIYIGSSISIRKRVSEHYKNKIDFSFITIHVMECSADMMFLESNLIAIYQPALNKRGVNTIESKYSVLPIISFSYRMERTNNDNRTIAKFVPLTKTLYKPPYP